MNLGQKWRSIMKRRLVLLDSDESLYKNTLEITVGYELLFVKEQDISHLDEVDFDLILISNKTKIKTPFDYLKDLRENWKGKPIFLVVDNIAENEIIFGYQLGMDGVIKWPCSEGELAAKINSEIIKYDRLLNFHHHSMMSFKLNQDLFELDVNGSCFKLTPLEFNILNLLKTNANTLVKKEQLLLNFRPELKHPEKTLNTHIYNMKKKIPILEKLIQSKKNIGYTLKLPDLIEVSGIKKGGSILIVDDEMDILDILTEIAKNDFANIFRAKNTQEALTVLDNEQIDLVLTDLRMIPNDGFFLLEQIQNKKMDVPIVICSAFQTKENELKAKSLGCSTFVSKPFVNAELLKTLSAHTTRIRQK